MKNEMKILRMTDRERICWLRANRVTLLVVGVVWIGMIAHQLSAGKSPWFLITMVPIFAILRLAAYKYYKKVILT